MEDIWKNAGKDGKPRFVGGMYCAAGAEVKEQAGAYLRDYYGFLGPRVEGMIQALPTTPSEIKDRIKAFQDVGMDELILWPCVADLDQVGRLAALVG